MLVEFLEVGLCNAVGGMFASVISIMLVSFGGIV